jgi:hypothetical protein
LFVRNWPCLQAKILTFPYHLSSHPQVVSIASLQLEHTKISNNTSVYK